jgi:serine phosphatase RsbU (regulator of sigma subunit)
MEMMIGKIGFGSLWRMGRGWTAVLLALLVSLAAQAQQALTLHDPTQTYALPSVAWALEDPSGDLGIDDVLSAQWSSAFANDGQLLSYGFTSSTYWFRFRLRNESNTLEGWMLEIPYPPLDEIEVFQLNADGQWQATMLGDLLPFYRRQIIYRNYLVPLRFWDHTTHTFYVRVRSSSSMRVPMQVVAEHAHSEAALESELLYGLYYGVMLVMLVYNLLVFFTLNDVSYLYYVVSIFFTLLLFSSLSGHAYQYIWYDSAWWANHTVPFAMGGLAIGSALFAQSFLEVRQYSRLWHWVLRGIVASGLGIWVATFLMGYGFTVLVGTAVLSANTLALLGTGITCWRKGNKASRYYVLAWSTYLAGALLIILVSYGVLPAYPAFAHAVEAGSAMEVTLLAIALSDKYSLLRKDRERLQAEALDAQRKATMQLEDKVRERTQEISLKREEIERKNKRLEKQHAEINQQKENIEGSIRYAQRIQAAMLPSEREIRRLLPDSFIFFRPRDIVSGDFYWVAQREGVLLLAVADCTGHGVPGAFMSMLGSNLLNEIVGQRGLVAPAQILEALNEGVRISLSQDYSQNHDGMELSVCAIDRASREITFAGANSPALLFNGGQVEVLKGDRMPIGGHRIRYQGRKFHQQRFHYEEGSTLYLFSDGFRDQFGGSNGEKFMMKRFQSMLKDIHQEPMEAQEIMITRIFKEWLGSAKQIDDVLVVGLRLD